MKTSLRVPFSLLLLVAAFTLILSRSAIHRGFGSNPFTQPANPPRNLTLLLRLAALDPAEPHLRREVEDLIDGHLPRSRHRTISAWRDTHYGPDIHIRPASARIRPPRDYRIFPEFRRALRAWIRNRRHDPTVFADLPALIRLPIDRRLARYNSCAVVGNSGILLKSAHGELIDGHEAVIRLNNARIQGYARHVGSKTTISFVNSNILHLCARRQGCFCHPYGESVPIVMYICQPIHFLDHAACNATRTAPLLVTDARFDVLCGMIVRYYSMRRFAAETGRSAAEWGAEHDERAFHYSSGMQAVVMAAGVCERVSVFGFGKSVEAQHHYHTNQKAELDLHDYEAEYDFYRDLAERPAAVPFLGDVPGLWVPPVVFYR